MRRGLLLVVVVVTVGVAVSRSASAQQPYAPPPHYAPAPQPYQQPTVYPQQAAPQYNAPSAYGPQNGTTARLQQAESSDSGRGLELVYAQASIGGSFVGLDTLSNSTLGLNKTSEGGPVLGLAGGLRLLFFTIGARARVNVLSDYDFWQLDLDAGYHVPIGAWDPYVSVHGGYAFATSASSSLVTAPAGAPSNFGTAAASDVAIHGGEAGLSGGVDYYLTPMFSVGADATADLLFLARPKQTPAGGATQDAASALLYSTSGSSVGLGLSASLHAGVHFGS